MTPLLDVRGVSKRFGGVQALQSVNFTGLPGEVHGLIGPNGAGKSTLVGCIAGGVAVDEGEVWCRGERIDGWPVHRRAALGVGRTFQKIRLAQALTVRENVAIGLAARTGFHPFRPGRMLAALSSREVATPVHAALDAAGIGHLSDEPVASLPYGQRHFVEIARALAGEPSVLLLDEPATGLTEPERERVAALVRRFADGGQSILLVEHDLALVGQLCDRVTVLDSGRRIFVGSPAEAQADAAVVAAYLGSATLAPKGRTVTAHAKRLAVTDLSVDYGGIVALESLSLHVDEGELIGLFGANGAGKSTALKAILGLVRSRTGRVTVNGDDVSGRPAHVVARRGVALVPEGRRIFKRMSVRENLQVGAVARASSDVARGIDEVFDLFPRLHERQRQLAGTLSGGEQQMLAIGRALMAAPDFVLYDEPSLGLAPMVVESVVAVIERLARERHIGGVLVEQNVEAALGIVSRGYVLARGQVALSGTASELRASPKLAEAYLGTLAG